MMGVFDFDSNENDKSEEGNPDQQGSSTVKRSNVALQGLTPRIIKEIFARIAQSPSNLEFTVKVSFMEIYMEKIRDLLYPSSDNLPIHEDKRGVYVKGIKEVYVSSLMETMEVLKIGTENRVVSSTNMNEQSSRSHSIFLISVFQKDTETGKGKVGKVYLVDLAGSEKVGKTGATGQTLEEAKKINKSLTALGMVINALTDSKSSHIPYRDSKLTRILQESLGGNSKTTLVINCSPSSFNDSETISTLRFGSRAKSIKNAATVNVELNPDELKSLLKKANLRIEKLKEHIKTLEEEVQRWRNGESVEASNAISLQLVDTAVSASIATIPSVLASPDSSTKTLEEEEFLRRENELSDLLSEKESLIDNLQQQVDSLQSQLTLLKDKEERSSKELKEVSEELNSVKLKLENISLEKKDFELTIESLKEENLKLSKENETTLDELTKLKLVQTEAKIDTIATPEKEVIKKDRTEQMMREMKSLSVENRLGPEIREQVQLDNLKADNESLSKEVKRLEDKNLKLEEELAELLDNAIDGEVSKQKNEENIKRFMAAIEQDYQEKFKSLEMQYKKELDVKRKAELSNVKVDTDDPVKLKQMIGQQVKDFNEIKTSLMKDLQNRCQKVVELEILLDETTEKYESELRKSNIKTYQKKLSLLERNLEQLTKSHKHQVELNSTLQRNLAIAEKKILNRNERIADLERVFMDLTKKMQTEQLEYLNSSSHLLIC